MPSASPVLIFLRISPCASLQAPWGILLSEPCTFLGVGERDVEHLHVGVHRLLDHLLEGLLLLLGLLLKGLLLLLGLLHPLLSDLLESLLLLFCLSGHVRPRSIEKLHVGVHQVLKHLLSILLLLLNLLPQVLHLVKPFLSTFRRLPSCVRVFGHLSPFSADL